MYAHVVQRPFARLFLREGELPFCTHGTLSLGLKTTHERKCSSSASQDGAFIRDFPIIRTARLCLLVASVSGQQVWQHTFLDRTPGEVAMVRMYSPATKHDRGRNPIMKYRTLKNPLHEKRNANMSLKILSNVCRYCSDYRWQKIMPKIDRTRSMFYYLHSFPGRPNNTN